MKINIHEWYLKKTSTMWQSGNNNLTVDVVKAGDLVNMISGAMVEALTFSLDDPAHAEWKE